MEYVKIHSLWKREGHDFDQKAKEDRPQHPKSKHNALIIGDYAQPEFGAIKHWRVDEKIDGTNVRILYKDGVVRFGGRTADAQMPCHLMQYLQDTFNDYCLSKAFPCIEGDPYPNVVLFGEGYGPKIQKGGGNYRSEVGFILFDIWIDGWWLKREDVKLISEKLLIPVVPDLGLFTEEEVVEFVKSKPLSRASKVPQVMEGVVCRSEPLMLFRNGKPIMFKLKCRDFE